MVGLVRQRGVLVLQARLPGFEFVEQGVEVLAQLAQLGDAGFRYALLEIPFAAHGMRDLRQLVERADDTAYQPPRQVEGAQGGKQQAQDHAGETGEQEAQQAAARPFTSTEPIFWPSCRIGCSVGALSSQCASCCSSRCSGPVLSRCQLARVCPWRS